MDENTCNLIKKAAREVVESRQKNRVAAAEKKRSTIFGLKL